MNTYYVSNGKLWDEVDKHIYDNHKFVVNPDGSRRYGDSRFSVINGVADLSQLSNLNPTQLGIICRILSVVVPSGAFHNAMPDGLIVSRGRSKYKWSHGQKWVLQETKRPATVKQDAIAA